MYVLISLGLLGIALVIRLVIPPAMQRCCGAFRANRRREIRIQARSLSSTEPRTVSWSSCPPTISRR